MQIGPIILISFAIIAIYGIWGYLVVRIVLGAQKHHHKQALFFALILLIFSLGLLLVLKNRDPFWWLVSSVNIVLSVFIIHLIVTTVLLIRSKSIRRASVPILLLFLALLYFDVIREKSIILAKLKNPWPFSDPIFIYADQFRPWRLPMSLKEIRENSRSREALNEVFRLRDNERIFYWVPGIVRKPDFGLKTWIADTLIYCTIYSYGFDNDDDSLKKIINLNTNEQSTCSTPYVNLYLLSPIPLDGDIELTGYRLILSIYDFHLDTTFVRQLFELLGDTLSPEGREVWLKKREHQRRLLGSE
jgi:hypothetical protein